MSRLALLGALLLSLASRGFACSCVVPGPLSERCPLAEGSAALLVTVQCVKSLRCTEFTGTAVADVVIDKVFQNKLDSNLTLAEGSMVTIKSELESSLCGFGGSFVPNNQFIVFVSLPQQPFPFPIPDDGGLEVVELLPGQFGAAPDDELEPAIELEGDDEFEAIPARRLMQRVSARITASSDSNLSTVDVSVGGDTLDQDSVFSDGTICTVMSADLETSLCSFNIRQPTQQNITDLMASCSGDPVIATMAR